MNYIDMVHKSIEETRKVLQKQLSTEYEGGRPPELIVTVRGENAFQDTVNALSYVVGRHLPGPDRDDNGTEPENIIGYQNDKGSFSFAVLGGKVDFPEMSSYLDDRWILVTRDGVDGETYVRLFRNARLCVRGEDYEALDIRISESGNKDACGCDLYDLDYAVVSQDGSLNIRLCFGSISGEDVIALTGHTVR